MIRTEGRYFPGGVNGGVFFRKIPPLWVFEWGNPMGDLAEGLERRADEPMVTKPYPSALFGTSPAAQLTAQGVDTVLLAGRTTSGCVRATCVDAMSSGFVTLVVSDAVGDRAAGPHKANLFDMFAKYADLMTTGEINTAVAEGYSLIDLQGGLPPEFLVPQIVPQIMAARGKGAKVTATHNRDATARSIPEVMDSAANTDDVTTGKRIAASAIMQTGGKVNALVLGSDESRRPPRCGTRSSPTSATTARTANRPLSTARSRMGDAEPAGGAERASYRPDDQRRPAGL